MSCGLCSNLIPHITCINRIFTGRGCAGVQQRTVVNEEKHFAITMGQHTKPPVRGSHMLNMLLSVFQYARLGLGLILKTAGG